MKIECFPQRRSCLIAVAAGTIGLAVWVLRVGLIGDLGTGIPFWDQWDREGLIIYEPWIQGKLTWQSILEPHLEHRIVWTHFWNLGLLKLCGQWDPVVQMVAQAAIPAVSASFCVWGLLPVRPDWLWRSAVLGGGLAAFDAPFAHGNILWGFQSSFALLVALSLAVCAATALAWTKKRFGWIALIIGMAAPFAMGAGALAGPIIIALTAFVTLAERQFSRRSGGMLTAGLICFLWGQYLKSDSTVMMFARAKTISDFLEIWLAALAWPNCRIPWLAALACLPAAVLITQIVRRRTAPHSYELFLVGVYIWAVGCAAGGAWTRGGLDRVPPSRYGDFLNLLCWANLMALVLVLRTWWNSGQTQRRIVGIVVAIAWSGATIFGGTKLLREIIQVEFPIIRMTTGRQFEAVNSVLGGAPVNEMIRAGLQNQPVVLEKVMHSPTLAPFLPAEIRVPPKNTTPDGILAMGMSGPHPEWKWQSQEFDLGMSAMIMFIRGQSQETRFALVDDSSGIRCDFMPSDRQLGEWKEWLVHVTPGRYHLDVETAAAMDDFTFMLPRPLSAIGYWTRRSASESGKLRGLALAGLVAALWVTRIKKHSLGKVDDPS